MAELGADVEQLDRLARKFETVGQVLATSEHTTTTAVQSVGWYGPDAEAFRSWWRRDGAARLTQAVGWLRELGTSLRKQAADQRSTSTAGSVGGHRPGGPPARPPGGDGSGDPDIVNGATEYKEFPRDEYGPFGPDGKGDPDLEDIDQRDLGDCWFLAGLGAITLAKPDHIRSHIKDNGDGTYTVTFYEKDDDGNFHPVEVTVDGDFPVDEHGNAAYAQPSGDETWVMIYEKAFAQWHGGYEDIEGGSAEDSMEAIYGWEFDRHNPEDLPDEELIDMLNDQPVAVGTKNPATVLGHTVPWDRDLVDRFDELGVHDGHQYVVTGTYERDGVTYVKLNNPWGYDHAELTIDEFRDVFDEVDTQHYYYDPPPPGGWQTEEPVMV